HAAQCGRVIGLWQAQNCVLLVCKVLYIFVVCNRLTPLISSPPVLSHMGSCLPGTPRMNQNPLPRWIIMMDPRAHAPAGPRCGSANAKAYLLRGAGTWPRFVVVWPRSPG